MSERILEEISLKMDRLIKLQSLSFLKEVESEQEKIKTLDSLGFRPVEIATILDKSQENVRVVLSQLRKKLKPNERSVPEGDTQSELSKGSL